MSNNFEIGLTIRKAVLGVDYVNRSLENATEFTQPFQELVTSYCWGEIWSREGLDKKTRSMLNLAMLTALNRGNELKLHTRGALNNGVSKEEIQEIFLQAAIYCGIPAALESFKIASEVISEYEANENANN
ncbi:MAG: 4-carboxymuconolactone decarboxylase [Pseudomonadales bacterium]|nr:4-carboxymuconolactone decarboxylase [Pseudomonadales bacterium]